MHVIEKKVKLPNEDKLNEFQNNNNKTTIKQESIANIDYENLCSISAILTQMEIKI